MFGNALLLLVPFFPKCSGSGPAPGAVCAGGEAEGLREGHWWEGAGEATRCSKEPGREGLATPADILSVEVGAGEVSRREGQPGREQWSGQGVLTALKEMSSLLRTPFLFPGPERVQGKAVQPHKH